MTNEPSPVAKAKVFFNLAANNVIATVIASALAAGFGVASAMSDDGSTGFTLLAITSAVTGLATAMRARKLNALGHNCLNNLMD